MMNIEKYYKEILENKDSFAVNEQTGEVSRCSKIICENCKFYYANNCYEYENCEEAKLSWLFEKNKEPILTDEGKEFLKQLIIPFEQFNKATTIDKSSTLNSLRIDYEVGWVAYTNKVLGEKWDLFKDLEPERLYTPEDLGLCLKNQQD